MLVRAGLVLFAALGLTGALLLSTEPVAAGGAPVTVGTGTPESCNDAALTAALNAVGSGRIMFNCGPAPVEFSISQKTINASLTIDGGNLITLSGGETNRLFVVSAGITLTLENIVLTEGYRSTDGGAIFNSGTLVLTSSTIQNSSSGARGGAIATSGPVTITNSTLANNSALNGGALLAIDSAAQVTIINSVLHDNHATGAAPDAGWGGAILLWDGADVTIQGGDIYNNTAARGGALHNVFANSSITLQAGTQVHENEATERGGGIYNLSGTATLSNVTLSNNSATYGGGGIYKSGGSATLNDVTVSNNSAVSGGGLFNDGGTITLTNVIVSGNNQGGIENLNGTVTLSNVTLSGNSGSINLTGGGMSNSGTAALTNVTLSGNSASSGGGFFNFSGTATMINVTISGNSAAGVQGVGGGITNRYGAVTLTNVTLGGNSAAVHGGGIYNESTDAGETITLKNTIVANSSAGGNCYREPGPGTIVSSGFNLSDDTSCTTYFNQLGDQNNPPAGASLGALANNGGQTQTHLPMPGSPAINHGNNATCPATDQRNFPRVGTCDVGSVEVQTSELATYTPTPTRTRTSTPTPSVTATSTLTATPTPTASITLTPSPTIPGAPTATGTGTPAPTATLGPVTSTPPSTLTQGAVTSTPAPTSTSVGGTPSLTPVLPSATPTLPPDTLDRISVYLQGATGAFQTDVRTIAASTLLLPPGGLHAVDVAIGDLTGDGLPDLVAVGTTNQGAGVRVLYPNLGQGALGVPTVYPSGGIPVALALANVNANATLDLAVANSGAGLGQIEYFPDGALGLPAPGGFTVLGEPVALALARITSDDLPDVAVAVSPGTSVLVVRNGTAQDPCSVAGAPRALALGRSNLSSGGVVDADLDLVTALPSGMLITENSLAPGPPPVGFCPLGGPSLTLANGLDVIAVALADLNGDGRLDVLALSATPPAVTVFLAGANPGSYGAGETSALPANPVAFALLPSIPGAPAGLVVAHAPAAGADSVSALGLAHTAGAGAGGVSVLGGTAGGSFTLLQSRSLTCPPSPRLRVAVGDVNGDGLSDFAVSGCAPAPDAPSVQGFSLATNPSGPALARWTGGTAQSGYRGLRIALPSSAVTFFPAGGGVLPANASGFDDPSPGAIGCYLTSVLGAPGGSQYQISDVICLYRGMASGATPPNFKAQLDGLLTTLTWAAPGGQTGYTLLVIPTDGAPLGSQGPTAGATTTTHNTGGAVTCYQLRTLGVAGQTDILCAIPNTSTLGVAGATIRGLFDRLRGLDLPRSAPTPIPR